MLGKFVKKIFMLLNWLVIVALLLSFSAAYISPSHVKILALFGLAFPYLIFLNVIFVLFWLALRKYQFLFSLVIILLFVVRNREFNKESDSKNSDETVQLNSEFFIMSYNVRVFDLYNWSNNKNSRNKILSFIRSKSPNIACFQEYFNHDGNYFPVHDSLMKHQKFKYAHVYYTTVLKNKHKFGIATYSIYPIINKQVITFAGTNNVVIYSDIKIKQDTIRLFNCHLESIRFNNDDYNFIDSIRNVSEKRRIQGAKGVYGRLTHAATKRSFQADELSAYIKDSPYPVFFCGDFNDTPSSYTYRTIKGDLSDSHHTNGKGGGGTYYRFIPAFRIDYILYDQNIECSEFSKYKVEYSDHYPIMGKYTLKKPA